MANVNVNVQMHTSKDVEYRKSYAFLILHIISDVSPGCYIDNRIWTVKKYYDRLSL